MTMLTELAEVMIGVDTHKHTHAAAVLDARTGAVIAGLTAAITVLRALGRRIRSWCRGPRPRERHPDPGAPTSLSYPAWARSWLPRCSPAGLTRAAAATSSPWPDCATTPHPRLCRPPPGQGKTDRQIKRCLKPYIPSELYRRLEHPATTTW